MKLSIFSPTQKILEKLKPKWKKELKKAGLLSSTRTLKMKSSTAPSLGLIPDIPSLALTPFKSDTSLTNGSSIAFLAEYENQKMLFAGDAYATTLLKSINKYLPKCEPLYLDLFKIPHHGSEGNISKELLERLRCSKYLISANGTYHKHPDTVAIAKIITYGGHKSDIYFNYRSKYTNVWKDPISQEQHHYFTHYPKKKDTGITIQL